MKKRTLSLLTVVCGLCLLFFACRKEISNVVQTNLPSASNNLLESAKIWNAKIVSDNYAVNSKIPGFITLDPLWNNAWTVKQEDGTTLIAVPTAVGDPTVRSITLARLFIFQASNNKITGAQIVEFFGLSDYSVTKNLESLVKNNQSKSIDGFNGAIIKYDLNYRWTSGSTYESGIKKHDSVSIVREKASVNLSSATTFSLNIPIKDVNGQTVSKSTFLYTSNNKLRVNDYTLDVVSITTTSLPVTPPSDPPPTGGNPGAPPTPPIGGGDSGGGATTVSDSYLYTCPDNFSFAPSTSADLWQECKLTNIYCTVGIVNPYTLQITNATSVQLPQVYFGLPYFNIEGQLLYTQRAATQIAADALNQGETDMRQYYKSNPNLTSDQLANYWLSRMDFYMKKETNQQAKAGRTGSINPANTPPSKPYKPCT